MQRSTVYKGLGIGALAIAGLWYAYQYNKLFTGGLGERPERENPVVKQVKTKPNPLLNVSESSEEFNEKLENVRVVTIKRQHQEPLFGLIRDKGITTKGGKYAVELNVMINKEFIRFKNLAGNDLVFKNISKATPNELNDVVENYKKPVLAYINESFKLGYIQEVISNLETDNSITVMVEYTTVQGDKPIAETAVIPINLIWIID